MQVLSPRRLRVAVTLSVVLSGCDRFGKYDPLLNYTGEPESSSTTSDSSTGDDPTETTGPDLCGNGMCDPGEKDTCSRDCEGCGDGMVVAPEECDDANDDNNDGCTDNCAKAKCGDDYVQTGIEVCDEKDNSPDDWTPTKRCKDDCQGFTVYCGDGICQTDHEDATSCAEDMCISICGNGQVEGDEPCDDANNDDTDDCLTGCKAARCGDGFTHAGVEECDDANEDETDDCLQTCKVATCGDGAVQTGVEDCDDANEVETDDCDTDCKIIEHRRVFVTSATVKGNFGGLADADMLCQILGGARNYKAWLSDSMQGPVNRFDTGFTGVYELPSGTRIAHGWTDLIDGELEHAIDQTENSDTIESSAVWSNTKSDGTPLGALHCVDWTNNLVGQPGSFGASDAVDGLWTNTPGSQPCSSLARIYCIEDL